MKILNLFCTMSGNTGKVALKIEQTALLAGHHVRTIEVANGLDENECNFLDYDFIFVGSGVYSWLPPRVMLKYLERQNKKHVARNEIVPCAPRLPGKKAVAYCTFGGPHTGGKRGGGCPEIYGPAFRSFGIRNHRRMAFPWRIQKPRLYAIFAWRPHGRHYRPSQRERPAAGRGIDERNPWCLKDGECKKSKIPLGRIWRKRLALMAIERLLGQKDSV